MFVQFTDEKQTSIKSYFAADQDPDVWPGIVEIDDDDPRLLLLLNPPAPVDIDPMDKLKTFLSENPDVAEMLK
ncbi:hypothetical protein [Pseudomonas abietaniphila]|uniref:Uncharacterized protein n=1 Tax=Pseudomonas abietaniphila TaxID=89065 RepID=A0A1G8LHN9_9PSED|nr:hypothetical protein [Pseudomonas abietaniphila]SDI54947.1 hypothetical protein SAMN05216605_114142 [Pseudomonas abietaniphila]